MNSRKNPRDWKENHSGKIHIQNDGPKLCLLSVGEGSGSWWNKCPGSFMGFRASARLQNFFLLLTLCFIAWCSATSDLAWMKRGFKQKPYLMSLNWSCPSYHPIVFCYYAVFMCQRAASYLCCFSRNAWDECVEPWLCEVKPHSEWQCSKPQGSKCFLQYIQLPFNWA